VRLLWSLPKAVPALLRHFMAYVELAGEDLERTQRDVAARLLATAILLFCLFFVVLTGCLLVVALTWDTSHRVSAILWMGGGFVAVALIAGLYRSQVIGTHTRLLENVRREWEQDRAIVDRLLSPDERES
jgi:uncharacterized membrane protein YqjE